MSEIVADAPAGASTGGGYLQRDGVDAESGNPVYRWVPAPATDPATLPPNHPDSLSPTKIELFIRPTKGEAFERGFQEACDAAGLTSPGFEGHVTQNKGFLHVYGSRAACCEDTGHALVWFSPNARYVQVPMAGTLKEIRVTVDPQQCPLPGSFVTLAYRFREGVQRLLNEMGDAMLVDGLGRPVDEQGIAALARMLNEVVEARELELKQRATVDLGNGRFRIQGRLSFQHMIESRGPRGAVREFDWVPFDAPVLRWGAGRAYGARMAQEHLAWLRSHRNDDGDLERTLQAAFAAMAEARPGQESPSRAHAAAGYIGLMVEALAAGGRFLNPAWINQRVEEKQQLQQTDEQWLAVKMARLRAARAAKKAQRQGGAA